MSRKGKDKRLTQKAEKMIWQRIYSQYTGTPISLSSVLCSTPGHVERQHFERAAVQMDRANVLASTDDPDVYIPQVPASLKQTPTTTGLNNTREAAA